MPKLEFPRRPKIVSNLICPDICFLILVPKLKYHPQCNLDLTYAQTSADTFVT